MVLTLIHTGKNSASTKSGDITNCIIVKITPKTNKTISENKNPDHNT